VLFDIHGNLDALEAVVEAAEQQGVDGYVLGGDYGMLGPEPLGVIQRVEGLPVDLLLRGNTERWVADLGAADIPNEVIRAACSNVADQLGPELVELLARLPDGGRLRDIEFAHASPESDMLGFFAEPGENESRLVTGVESAALVAGHTHQQFRRPVGTLEVINPGSVGIPLDGDSRAAWALLGDDGSVELRRTAYDTERPIAKLEAIGTEWALLAARRLREARP
jgi:predicted phosphodiesterase